MLKKSSQIGIQYIKFNAEKVVPNKMEVVGNICCIRPRKHTSPSKDYVMFNVHKHIPLSDGNKAINARQTSLAKINGISYMKFRLSAGWLFQSTR